MTCPRCGSLDHRSVSDYADDEGHGICIIRHTDCATCGFSLYNVIWDGGDEIQYRGWMTGEDIPEDLPEAARRKVLDEYRKSA